MVRPLRDTDPLRKHLITLRTQEAAIWMVPGQDVNRLIGGVVARYQEIFAITIYAYSVQGNHYHFLLKASDGHLDEFLENVNREVARRINWRNGRRAKFWARRYDDEVVLSEKDELEALLYVTCNPTKHGLISHPRDWPGLNCYAQLLDERVRNFEFTHYAKRLKGEVIKTVHTLTLTPLDQHASLSPTERRKTLNKLITERVELYREERAKEGKGFSTASWIRKQKPGSLPKNIERSPRPACYSKDASLIREYRSEQRELRRRYDEASFEYRSGNHSVVFPPFTFKPPLHRKPRVIPFGHLTQLAA